MPEFSTWFPATYLPSEGFKLEGSNTDCVNDPLNGTRSAVRLFQYQDGNRMSPGFSGSNILTVELITNASGHNAYRGAGAPAGVTLGKHTFTPFSIQASHYASGQRFLTEFYQYAYGMGDSCVFHIANYYWGGPIGGDEGQGYQLVAPLAQGFYLHLGDITAVLPRSGLDTTTTQAIVAGSAVQTVTVASAAGAVVGDWVAVEQQPEDGTAITEGVKLTAVNLGANTISGVFLNNHPSGIKIRPALVLNYSGVIAQGRVLVNLSGTAHSTGTVTGVSGGQFIGTGTGWSASMAGGDADNVGAIALDVDTYAGPPFNGSAGSNTGPLKSWHQIIVATDATHLAIHSASGRGDASYKGRLGSAAGVTTSTYTIRPAARILRRDEDTGYAVCEYSPHTWSAGHLCECAICPFPDVQGFSYALSQYTPNGASNRGFMEVTNRGARTMNTAFSIYSLMPAAAGVDPYAFNIGYDIRGCKIPIVIGWSNQTDMQCAIQLASRDGDAVPNDNGSKIDFRCGFIMANSDAPGLRINGGNVANLQFYWLSATGETRDRMDFDGHTRLHGWLDIEEFATAPAATANYARIYAKDNGAGKTQLVVRFLNNEVILATET